MDGKNIDNGVYVVGVGDTDRANYYQVTVADNFIEIRDFTTHAKLLDLIPDTADDVRRILGRILTNDHNTRVFIDEVMERCSCKRMRSWRSSER